MGVSTSIRGKEGELIAEEYLSTENHRIISKNYRFGKFEIDLIVVKDGVLIFVEVKLRESTQFGFPEEFVSDSQADRIRLAAEDFLEKNSWQGPIRFDILAIESHASHKYVSHFKDAF